MMDSHQRSLLRIVIVGHVDHGKSTLVGRLFYETGSLPEGKYEAIRDMCERRGLSFEWAFLMDALQAERDQGITIDTSQIWFKTQTRDYVLIDAPGHKEFLKNMITGAAQSDAALLVIDAAEGMQEQSRRHGYLLHLIGVRQIAVAVNKMDRVGWDENVFGRIEKECRAYFSNLGITPLHIIPVSAKHGDNINAPSQTMPWYSGATIVDMLDDFSQPELSLDRALRFPVQDVYKFDDRRIIAGRIESGRMRVGDRLVFSPSNKTAHVKTIESWPKENSILKEGAGASIGITLDEQVFIERGEIASHETNLPVESDVFRAHIFWLSHKPLRAGAKLKIKLATMEAQIIVQAIEKIIDTQDLSSNAKEDVEHNQVAELVLRASRILAFDQFSALPDTGRFVLVDGYDIAGGGIISMEGYADQRRAAVSKSTNITRIEHRITTDVREQRQGHKGGVVWLTGLSGSGKSTLALGVEQELFHRGFSVYVLDGDNIRFGLNNNLSFSPEDRAENIRRIGEVAALFARAGFVAVTSFISPYRSDRAQARQAVDNFHEVYVKASVEDCETRDPKGLYKKARAGEIKNFTGISAPYEEPLAPDFIVDTWNLSVQDSVMQLVDHIEANFKLYRQ